MTTGARIFRPLAAMALVGASGAWFAVEARAQGGAIAYQPNVGAILDGAALSVTPVVSADRRYVRMTLNPYFNTVNGFSTYSSQLGAVSGGGFAGMGGAIGGGIGVPMNPGFAPTGNYLAGSFPPPGMVPGSGFVGSPDPFSPGMMPTGAVGTNVGFPGQGFGADPTPPDQAARAAASAGQPSTRAGKNAASRRQVAKKPSSRRPAPTSKRRR